MLNNAKLQAEGMSKTIIEKNKNLISSKEKNSIERIKQIELATIQTIKFQASIKLNEKLIGYFENMPDETKKIILKNRIDELHQIQ